MSKNGSSPNNTQLIELYRTLVTSREIDRLEGSYTGRGEAAFYVSGAGHEASAALAAHLQKEDWLCCHYRDKALLLARGMSPEEMFRSLFARSTSFSRGRQMHGLLSFAEGKVVSLATPVGNNALHAVGIAESLRDRGANQLYATEAPVVVCSLGDGTTQEGEVLEAIAQAVREKVRVLFLIQDNSLAISTRTRGNTFFSLPGVFPQRERKAENFYGIPIRYFNGRDPVEAWRVFQEEVAFLRTVPMPRILVMEVERLASHSNADDQKLYRTEEELEKVRLGGDPIQNLRKYLLDKGVEEKSLLALEKEIQTSLEERAEKVRREKDPLPAFTALKPYPAKLIELSREIRGKAPAEGEEGKTMLEALREVLRSRLETDERVILFGEDIEDPKGDVFGLTRGLSTAFPGRVRNSPLAEATIVGVSIGRALAGERPVAFIQFADFLPIAFNQIFSELACMYWRTDGSWQVPVIVMVTCGGYRPGLGPFHASTLESLMAHTPGLDVFMPSTAADAAGLLNAAFESGRPTIFFYPKTLLNDRERAVVGDPASLLVPPGRARIHRLGKDITLLGWGNTVPLCERAADSLAQAGIEAEVIDLRSLMPWDKETVIASARKTGHLLVTHEDNHTAGMGAEIVATVSEEAGNTVRVCRITRPDTWVPFHFENQLEILPSYKRILEGAVELLGGTIQWERPLTTEEDTYLVEALGSSPADESVTVLEWKIQVGDTVQAGQSIAELEADKAALELNAPVAGTVLEILVGQGELVKVGTPLLKLKLPKQSTSQEEKTDFSRPYASLTVEGEPIHTKARPILREDPGKPLIHWRKEERHTEQKTLLEIKSSVPESRDREEERVQKDWGKRLFLPVALVGVAGTVGSRQVSNEEIAQLCPTWKPEDILKRTGIASRPWIAEGESALTLALSACQKVLHSTGTPLDQIRAIVCATGTPLYHTPSMAALIQYELGRGEDTFLTQAMDINAACSGYLYALQIAFDFLQSEPEATVLLVTTEVLSQQTDHQDPVTCPLFADAATASLLVGGSRASKLPVQVHRPVLAAKGEPAQWLRVPAAPEEKIFMEGQKVFVEAIKGMMRMLDAACEQAGLSVKDLDLVVPHQANQRILNAVRQKYRLPENKVYSNIQTLGNTSSSTIPLCLEEIFAPLWGQKWGPRGIPAQKNSLEQQASAKSVAGGNHPGGLEIVDLQKRPFRIGLTAFGGGFTFGGGILEVR
ncbi:MAG: thiamine pyrophosphate-dependent enzyme [Spirochaetales bacterium]